MIISDQGIDDDSIINKSESDYKPNDDSDSNEDADQEVVLPSNMKVKLKKGFLKKLDSADKNDKGSNVFNPFSKLKNLLGKDKDLEKEEKIIMKKLK